MSVKRQAKNVNKSVLIHWNLIHVIAEMDTNWIVTTTHAQRSINNCFMAIFTYYNALVCNFLNY